MADIEIVLHPSPVLRQKAKPVRKIGPNLKKLLDDMAQAMYEAHGVGLAGNQVGVLKRVIVVDVGEGLLQLINPEIVQMGPEREEAVEGCLSIPGLQGDVPRATKLRLRATLPDGRVAWWDAEGMFARCVQHEVDHLNGVLFLDRATRVFEVEADDEDASEDGMPAATKADD